ncbi:MULTISPECIES: type IV pilin-like G/H family protein [unclassified Leptolyngbya]|jgi:type IV pilus assembly protein PilA|uniref:type IV pilin protein n=1 Tax=unclassified Leptolyngbya TaxID=2650499 RepID=UPI001686E415|nr:MULTISPECIES: type IV pilin-like G/H family protein [unclassified Leptolyngbya]MBD1913919.1 prepilin-type N-terminal cleavage/methylation domain-containing protein [Leptolyngbya sp. FACHB-8]MBD2156371.1 prepilin-type N-terminal cleavage/methylation domain-containing protein [Leptolyngbya sp. FACHB-16]
MKTELKAKFIQHLAQKRQDSGFTLIELLVVIVIIGILSAIALPSFLNQANKARQSEAKTYVGSINRAQQAYFVEYGTFSPDGASLEGGIASSTQNYTYVISGNSTEGTIQASARKNALKAYGGRVWVSGNTTPGIVCETTASTGPQAAPAMTGLTACPATAPAVGQ